MRVFVWDADKCFLVTFFPTNCYYLSMIKGCH
jgi:hypothetical protein